MVNPFTLQILTMQIKHAHTEEKKKKWIGFQSDNDKAPNLGVLKYVCMCKQLCCVTFTSILDIGAANPSAFKITKTPFSKSVSFVLLNIAIIAKM